MRLNEDLSSVENNLVRALLNKPDVNKPSGHNGVHPQLLQVLTNVTMRPLLIFSEKSRQLGEVSQDWKTANATRISKQYGKKHHGKYWPVNFTFIPEKLKQIILETISTLYRGQQEDLEWWLGFTKGKSCLTNLIAFCDEITNFLGKSASPWGPG